MSDEPSFEGRFPASFTISFRRPPPKEVLFPTTPRPPETLGGPPLLQDRGPFALGWVVAIEAGTDETNVRPQNVLGYSLESMVVYVPRDPDPNDPKDPIASHAELWNIPATKGYHLARLDWTERESYDACQWNGLCRDFVDSPCRAEGMCSKPGAPSVEWHRVALHEGYLRCVEAFPDAETCSIDYLALEEGISEEERMAFSAQNAACYVKEEEHTPEGECELPVRHSQNSDGFETEVTVTLGTQFFDVSL